MILDPFSGRGRAPFQALLMERNAIACDISPVAYCITRAKTNAPAASSIRRRVTQLESAFSYQPWERHRRALPSFFHVTYAARTLRQILYLRETLQWRTSDVDTMIAALVLGSLHGESEKSGSYLSNQMPHTIATKPAYSERYWEKHGFEAPERDTFELLRDRVDYRYESEPPEDRATVFNADMRSLPSLLRGFKRAPKMAVTSPPYRDVTNFEEDQWLRNWFLGGPAHQLIIWSRETTVMARLNRIGG